jgi:hypothetical protein
MLNLGCGKSTALQSLAGALTYLFKAGDVDSDGMYKSVVLKTLNPKAITLGELYGSVSSVYISFCLCLLIIIFIIAV